MKVIWGGHDRKKVFSLWNFNTDFNRASGRHYLSSWSEHGKSWNRKRELPVKTSRLYRMTCRWSIESIRLKTKAKVFGKLALGSSSKITTLWRATPWPPIKDLKFAEIKRTICLRRVKIEKLSPWRKEEKAFACEL